MNKKLVSIISIVLASCSISFAQNKYTLEESINYAITNHTSIKNAQLDQLKSKSKIAETRAIGLPQIEGNIDFMGTVEPQKQFMEQSALAMMRGQKVTPEMVDEVGSLSMSIPYSTNAGVTVTQLLFNGSYFVGLEAAKTYKELSDRSLEKTIEDVKVNVTKAYYGSLVNKHRLSLLNANKAQIEKLQADAKVMFEAGVLEEIELSKLTISHNNLLSEIEKVEAVQIISDNLLKYQMGLPITTEIELTETLESVLLKLEVNNIPSFTAENRIDYKLLQTQLTLAKLDVKNQKMVGLPTAALFGNFGVNYGATKFDNLSKFDEWGNYSFVGAKISIPIFSSFQNKNMIDQKKFAQYQMENNIQMAKDGFRMEYEQHVESYNNYIKSLERHETNLKLAQEVFDNAKIKYQNGIGSNYDLIVAETSLKQAQTYYLGAVYDLLVTKVELDKVTGNLK